MINGKTNGFKNSLQVVESLESGEQKIYNSVFVDPKYIDIIRNDLAMQIVGKLAGTKSCAMDLSRELKQHEQKIYYHIRRLEQAGIIKRAGVERRFGMLAKMFTATSPIVSAKLYEDGAILKQDGGISGDLHMLQFFHPFVHEGKLDAKIIIGDTYSHGRFDTEATEGNFSFDLALLLGGLVRNPTFPNYKLDTEVMDADLKNNLILIGNAKTNMIIDKINEHLPLFFDEKKDFCVASRINGKTYDDPRIGIILKINNPFDSSKKILLIGGKTRGTRAAFLGCTIHIKDLLSKLDKDGNLMCLVKGFDKDGDKVIDEIKFVEDI